MKPIFFFIMIFGTTALTAFADLNSNNLNEIRLIVQEEVKAEITVLKKDLKAEIGKNAEKLKRWAHGSIRWNKVLLGCKVILIKFINKRSG